MFNLPIKEADIKGGDGYFAPTTTEALRDIGTTVLLSAFQISDLKETMQFEKMDEEQLADRERILEEGYFSD